MSLANSLGRGLDAKRRNDISASQLEKWTTFTYYTCPRKELAHHYHPDTLRADWYKGACIVSANRRNRFTRWCEALYPGFMFYGRRALLEIHVRR